MNDTEIRALLEAAKLYRNDRVAEIERELGELRRRMQDAERRLDEWSKMIPYDVAKIMADEADRQQAKDREREEDARIERCHTFALKQAYEKHKGILPPEASFKSTSFGIWGGIMFGLLTVYIATHHFNVGNGIALLVLGTFGGAVGLCAGGAFFHHNFVVDESLERSILANFPARDTVRRMFFKDPP